MIKLFKRKIDRDIEKIIINYQKYELERLVLEINYALSDTKNTYTHLKRAKYLIEDLKNEFFYLLNKKEREI